MGRAWGKRFEKNLIVLLKTMTFLERGRFLMKYAQAHGRKWERYYDNKGYKRRRRAS